MRTADVDILMIPGWSGSGPDHWQSRWERSLKTARRVEQADWLSPGRDAWVVSIHGAIAECQRPVLIIAHSLGVIATAHALASNASGAVVGAILVAPADIENAQDWPMTQGQRLAPDHGGFAPVLMTPLPCPSRLIASTSDPYCTLIRAQAFAAAWGAVFVDAGDAGHINVASGHGPWPDGLMQLGGFLRSLDAAAPATAN
jgi:uncharacterized protein